MQIYLPIAEMAVSAELIVIVSAFVGLLSGLFGIGGGFLTTPFLIFIGISPGVAVATQPCQIAANGTSGVIGYFRRSAIDVKMAVTMMIGGAFGSYGGVNVFRILEAMGQIDFVISLIYAVLLLFIGVLMMSESLMALIRKKVTIRREFNSFKVSSFVAKLPFKIRYERSRLYISALVPLAVGLVSGVIAAILGIGGGFLLVPAMIYIIGMPGSVIPGTSLLQIVFTTSFAVVLHAVTNQSVDIVLAVVLIIGGVIGAQVGVFLSNYVKGIYARILLASIILLVGLRLSMQLFITPEDLFSTVIQ